MKKSLVISTIATVLVGHFNDRDRARCRRGSHHSDLCVVLDDVANINRIIIHDWRH